MAGLGVARRGQVWQGKARQGILECRPPHGGADRNTRSTSSSTDLGVAPRTGARIETAFYKYLATAPRSAVAPAE